MNSSPRVVHLTQTPLVGAPGRITAALNAYTTFQAICFVATDYPGSLEGKFLDHVVLWDGSHELKTLLTEVIRQADIVHIHNDLSDDFHEILRTARRPASKCVHHLHSALREGPLFVDPSTSFDIELHAWLTIPHCSQRSFQHHRMVPNIVMLEPSCNPLAPAQLPKILFSPSHNRTGQRWSDKHSDALNKTLDGLDNLKLANVHRASGVRFSTLTEFRRTSHISIDEITTGAMHQVSLEGLATGNVVINGADFATISSLVSSCRANEAPPFVRLTDETVREGLLELIQNPTRIVQLQRASYEYFQEYLRPEKLIQRFVEVYSELLDA